MPWNPFKSKKNKASKSEPIRSGFHPIDIDALSATTGGDDTDAGKARGNEAAQDVTSPARSDNSVDDPPLRDYPDYGRDGLLSAAFTGDTTVLKLMLALGPEVNAVLVRSAVRPEVAVVKCIDSRVDGRPSCTSLIRSATLRSILPPSRATSPQ